jgi:tetratricopeptide (TPR) repeat protein
MRLPDSPGEQPPEQVDGTIPGALAIKPINLKSAVIMTVRDRSNLFTYILSITWLAGVAVPILYSLISGNSETGLPLLGVVFWFLLVRGARWLSPAAQADSLMRRGRYKEALALCDRALAIEGVGAWVGTRRLVWLNRRTTALISLGCQDKALQASLDALNVSADPETLGNCALALLRLNRYDDAMAAVRLALALTRERSVLCHGVLSMVMLAKGKPAEAEAAAAAGLEDSRALYPFVRLERYTICLAATARAVREQTRNAAPGAHSEYFGTRRRKGPRQILARSEVLIYQKQWEIACLDDLRRIGRRSSLLQATAQLEEADSLSDQPEQTDRVFSLLGSAYQLAPEYCFWFLQQPGTFHRLDESPRVITLRQAAGALIADWNKHAPDAETVKQALKDAEVSGRARPAIQSSYSALAAQLITLGSTFTLLLVWTWRFLILTS